MPPESKIIIDDIKAVRIVGDEAQQELIIQEARQAKSQLTEITSLPLPGGGEVKTVVGEGSSKFVEVVDSEGRRVSLTRE